MHHVYRVVNLLNGKSYIGLTNSTPMKRWTQHVWLASCSKQRSYRTLMSDAIRKYGKQMFRISTLKVCYDRAEAAAEEVRLIALLRPEYNLTAGGEGTLGTVKSAAVRAKISAAQKGRMRSPELRQRLSAANKAKPKPTGAVLEQLRKNAAKAQLAVQVPVRCTTDGNTFASASDAARFYGVAVPKVVMVCRRNRNHTGGLHFEYAVH